MDREHGLVGLERPLARHVAVADWVTVAHQVVVQRLVGVETGEPQTRAARVRGNKLDVAVAGERDVLAGAAAAERRGAVAAAELDNPPAAVAEAGRGCGKAQLEGGAIVTP